MTSNHIPVSGPDRSGGKDEPLLDPQGGRQPSAMQEEEEAMQTLQTDLVNLQTELEKFRDLALRSQADLDNYRKRAAREKDEAIRFANANLIDQLLPIIDSFELGLDAARKEGGHGPILQGMGMVQKQLEDFLKGVGVETVAAEDMPFDHNLHEAVMQEHSGSVPEGHVIRRLRKGYTLRGRLLRAANVAVSKGPQAG